jgi:hypothetical protein
MPTSANQQNEVKRNQENSFRKPIRKAPGTRMGTVQDWRGEINKSGKTSGRHGQSIRDGR